MHPNDKRAADQAQARVMAWSGTLNRIGAVQGRLTEGFESVTLTLSPDEARTTMSALMYYTDVAHREREKALADMAKLEARHAND